MHNSATTQLAMHALYSLLSLHCRVVKKSSYRLNSLILVAVLIGFVGTLIHIIKLDSDMSKIITTTVCNVSKYCLM